MPNSLQTIILTKNQIQEAVERMVGEIAVWMKEKPVKGLNLVSVLEGARPFARDLTACLRKLVPRTEIFIHEVRIKGTDGKSLLETREWKGGFLDPVALGSAPILIVDDLVDSGLTLKTLKDGISSFAVGEVKTAVLIRKFCSASGPVDFCGVDLGLNHETLAQKGLKDYWLFGYGMDLDERYRELDYIGWVEIK